MTKSGKKVSAIFAAMCVSIAIVVAFAPGASSAESADLTFAREQLRNCQLLQGLPNLTSGERTQANRCVTAQTKLIASLTAGSPSPSPSVSTSSSPPSPSASPSPTPSPSPTSTPPPPGQTNCWSQLAACGYPHPGNTGVPANLVLATYTGPTTITVAGTVIDGKAISSALSIQAANVTIRNSRTREVQMSGGTLLIEDSDVDCLDYMGTGLAGRNFTARRLEMRRCENAFDVNGNNLIEDTYLTDVREVNGGHGDGIQNYTPSGSSDITIRHTTFDLLGPITSSIITWPEVGALTVENSYLMAGAYTLYCPEDPISQTIIRNNRFYPYRAVIGGPRLYFDNGDRRAPAYGQTDACTDSRITWTGNYQDNDLRLVPSGGLN